MKISKVIYPVAASISLVLMVVTTSFAELPSLAGIVTHVFGTATLQHGKDGEARPIKFKDKVYLQDSIATNEDSVVRVLMGNKALVTISEMSVLTITEEVNHATLDVESGTIGLSVARKRMNPGEYIEIRTPHAVAAIRGTKVVTEVANRHESRMTVIEGQADMLRLRSDPNHRIPMLTDQIIEFKKPKFGKTRLKKLRAQKRKFHRAKARAARKALRLAENVDSPAENDVAAMQMKKATELAKLMVEPDIPVGHATDQHEHHNNSGSAATSSTSTESSGTGEVVAMVSPSGSPTVSTSESSVSSSGSGTSAPAAKAPAPAAKAPAPAAKAPAPAAKAPAPAAKAPAPVVKAPAPVVKAPAPAAKAPAPVVKAPAPVVKAPAPVVKAPAPVVKAPAPVVKAPAPVVKAPAPVVKAPAPRLAFDFKKFNKKAVKRFLKDKYGKKKYKKYYREYKKRYNNHHDD